MVHGGSGTGDQTLSRGRSVGHLQFTYRRLASLYAVVDPRELARLAASHTLVPVCIMRTTCIRCESNVGPSTHPPRTSYLQRLSERTFLLFEPTITRPQQAHVTSSHSSQFVHGPYIPTSFARESLKGL